MITPAITARAMQIASEQFEQPSSAWARRSVRPSDPQWTRAAVIRRYFWLGALAQAEREAAAAKSDLPAAIFMEIAEAEAACTAADHIDGPGWHAASAATAARLARANEAAAAYRADALDHYERARRRAGI